MRRKVLSNLCGIGASMLIQNQGMAADQPVAVGSTPVATTSSSTTITTNSAPVSPSTTTTTVSTATTTAATPATTPAAAPAPDPKAIEDQLHDLADTLKKTYNAAQNLQSECNRTYNADALDNMIMDPWMEGQPGLAHVQPPFPGALKPMPARRKWVDYDEAQITQLLRMLTNEVNAIGPASSLSK
jgi:phage tail protein X